MRGTAEVLIAIVAALHLWFLVLEMFLWRTPIGLKTFGQSATDAETTATLAANQGLYNGFLVAGLVWSLIARDPVGFDVGVFFLSCVVVAGAYGAATVSRRILFIQATPAAVALVLLISSR